MAVDISLKYICLFGIILLFMINESLGANCTINPMYAVFGDQQMQLTMCTAPFVCEPFLVPNTKYTHCLKNNITSDKFAIKVLTKKGDDEETYKSGKCDMSNAHTYTPTDCALKDNYNYTGGYSLTAYDIFAVQCGAQGGGSTSSHTVEIPDASQGRMQFTYSDSVSDATITIQVPPITRIYCVPQCLQDTGKIQLSLSDTTVGECEAANNYCIIGIQAASNKKTTNVLCKMSSRANVELKLMVQPIFDYNVVVYALTGFNRTNTNFDSGEILTCYATPKDNTTDNNTRSISNLNLNIAIFTLDANGKKIFFNKYDAKSVELGENLPDKATYDCYSGNKTNPTNPKEYHSIKSGEVVFGSRVQTHLLLYNEVVVIKDGKVELQVGNKIKCDPDKYQGAIQILVGTCKEYLYPRSDFKNFPEYKLEETLPEYTVASSPQGLIRFVTCKSVLGFSTPVELLANDRPRVEWYYYNPPWQTQYHLKGFVVGCIGTHVSDVMLVCSNCPVNAKINIKSFGKYHFYAELLHTMQANVKATLRCSGQNGNFPKSEIFMDLNIIVSQYTDLDPSKVFYLAGADRLLCKAQFTTYEQENVRLELPMKTWLKQDNTEYTESNITGITIPPGNVHGITKYSYCCPRFTIDSVSFDRSKYTCIGYRDLDVAKDFYELYSTPLNNIFPGTLLRCFICVNLTIDLTIQKCIGRRHKIPSKIQIRVQKPSGQIYDSGLQDEVQAPVEELKPDKKSYYKITEYKVELGCLTRFPQPVLHLIKMKSCQINPPDVFISPQDKTMFEVGESVSCSTTSTACKNGMSYTIYVQRGNEPAEKKTTSFTFERRHSGNNIVVKCAAGESETASDTRTVRVEVAPYNISIEPLLNYVTHGHFFRCHASGFPPPTYSWTQLKGKSQLRISETFVLIGPWDFTDFYRIKCEAHNKRNVISKTVQFNVFNPRITNSDFSPLFYSMVPILTIIYIGLLSASILLVFQENFFGVPFFSSNIVDVGNKPSFETHSRPPPSAPKPSSKVDSAAETNN